MEENRRKKSPSCLWWREGRKEGMSRILRLTQQQQQQRNQSQPYTMNIFSLIISSSLGRYIILTLWRHWKEFLYKYTIGTWRSPLPKAPGKEGQCCCRVHCNPNRNDRGTSTRAERRLELAHRRGRRRIGKDNHRDAHAVSPVCVAEVRKNIICSRRFIVGSRRRVWGSSMCWRVNCFAFEGMLYQFLSCPPLAELYTILKVLYRGIITIQWLTHKLRLDTVDLRCNDFIHYLHPSCNTGPAGHFTHMALKIGEVF